MTDFTLSFPISLERYFELARFPIEEQTQIATVAYVLGLSRRQALAFATTVKFMRYSWRNARTFKVNCKAGFGLAHPEVMLQLGLISENAANALAKKVHVNDLTVVKPAELRRINWQEENLADAEARFEIAAIYKGLGIKNESLDFTHAGYKIEKAARHLGKLLKKAGFHKSARDELVRRKKGHKKGRLHPLQIVLAEKIADGHIPRPLVHQVLHRVKHG